MSERNSAGPILPNTTTSIGTCSPELNRLHILPSILCTDQEFLRRAFLDLCAASCRRPTMSRRFWPVVRPTNGPSWSSGSCSGPVLPAGVRAKVESPGQRVDSFPFAREPRLIRRRIDRSATRRELGEALVHLIANVPAHRFAHDRRKERRGLAGCRDDDGAARVAGRGLARAAGQCGGRADDEQQDRAGHRSGHYDAAACSR